MFHNLERAAGVEATAILAWLWASFTIFHHAKPATWSDPAISTLEVALATAVLLSPSCLPLFTGLMAVQVARFALIAPEITNHAVLAGFIDLTMLAALIWLALQPPKAVKAELFSTAGPAIRVQLLLLYLLCWFHKLNTDFLQPEYSAAVVHYRSLSSVLVQLGLPSLPVGSTACKAAIYGTLAIELGIPLLLLCERSRLVGVGIALGFHFTLGVERYIDFSALVYALLLFFLPTNFPELLERRLTSSPLGRHLTRGRAGLAYACLMGSLALFASVQPWQVSLALFQVVWVFYAAGLMLALIWVGHGAAFTYASGFYRIAPRFLLVFPALLLGNGCCPYLGLKTRSCFAMFSNLRTEGETNHLLVPAWTQVFHYQRDLVQIEESSDPDLARLAHQRVRLPYFNLRKVVGAKVARGDRNIHLVFRRGRVLVSTDHAEADPELTKPISFLERKLLLFGEINQGPHQLNRH